MEQVIVHLLCSYAPSLYDKPITVEFFSFLQKILGNYVHQVQCAMIRSITDKKQRDKYKRQLPVFVVAVFLSGGTTSKHIVGYTGLCFFDFDGDSESLAKETKSRLIDLMSLYALYIGFSISGKGVHMVIRIKYPESFDEHWYAAFCFLTENGFKPDEQAKDATRKMVIGGDQKPFLNPRAIPFEERKGIPQTWLMQNNFPVGPMNITNDPSTRLKKIIDTAYSLGKHFASGHRNAFLTCVTPMAIRFGISKDDFYQYMNDQFSLSSFPEHIKTVEYLYNTKSGEFGRYLNTKPK
jgi:hypothetical protein